MRTAPGSIEPLVGPVARSEGAKRGTRARKSGAEQVARAPLVVVVVLLLLLLLLVFIFLFFFFSFLFFFFFLSFIVVRVLVLLVLIVIIATLVTRQEVQPWAEVSLDDIDADIEAGAALDGEGKIARGAGARGAQRGRAVTSSRGRRGGGAAAAPSRRSGRGRAAGIRIESNRTSFKSNLILI